MLAITAVLLLAVCSEQVLGCAFCSGNTVNTIEGPPGPRHRWHSGAIRGPQGPGSEGDFQFVVLGGEEGASVSGSRGWAPVVHGHPGDLPLAAARRPPPKSRCPCCIISIRPCGSFRPRYRFPEDDQQITEIKRGFDFPCSPSGKRCKITF